MKIRIIKAGFALLLNQASLLSGGSFPVIAAAFPCSAFSFPCSAFSLPCYRITAKIVLKVLIKKDNKSNKLPQNREEKFSFPVLSLLWAINRESGALSAARANHSIDARKRRSSLASVRMPRILPVAPNWPDCGNPRHARLTAPGTSPSCAASRFPSGCSSVG